MLSKLAGENLIWTRVGEDDLRELRLVSEELKLGLDERDLKNILRSETRQEIEDRRAAIRELETDPERLLAAVGEELLRKELPDSLLTILEGVGVPLTGSQVADAAIRFTGRAEVYNEGRSPAKPFSANGETVLSRLSHYRGPPQILSLGVHFKWLRV